MASEGNEDVVAPFPDSQQMHYRVDAEAMQAALNALGTLPYAQVHKIIAAVQVSADGPIPGPARQAKQQGSTDG
jgi:hypothetical protein